MEELERERSAAAVKELEEAAPQDENSIEGRR